MASSTTKKVVVRRFDRENLSGFINAFSYLQPTAIEILKPDGTLVLLPYDEVKSAGTKVKYRVEAVGQQVTIKVYDNDELRSELAK